MPVTKIIFIADATGRTLGNGHPNEFTDSLTRVKSELGQPAGFVSASVKWRPMGKFLVNRSSAPVFLGENPPRFELRGEPQLASLIEKAADATGLWAEATDEWGLDPGHWGPLSHLRPETSFPVVPLSLSQMSPEAHRKWGVAIRRGTQKWLQPLALVVSGSLSARLDIQDSKDSALEKAKKFDDEIVRMLQSGMIGELDEMDKSLFKAAQPEGGWGSLFFLWGALGENVPGTLHYYDRPLPGAGLAAFSFDLTKSS